MDFHTWRNTVLYGQGDLVRFADPNTKDSERKDVLKRVLRLEVLDRGNQVRSYQAGLLGEFPDKRESPGHTENDSDEHNQPQSYSADLLCHSLFHTGDDDLEKP